MSILRTQSRADRHTRLSDGRWPISNGVDIDPRLIWHCRFYYRRLRRRGISPLWAREVVVQLMLRGDLLSVPPPRFVSYTRLPRPED